MNKFGFICSRKGEIFWRKTQRNEKNSAITRPQAVVSPSVTFLFWLVNELRRMIKNILCLQGFFLNVLKFDLYLLKQSIFRVLKRDLERAYLMIVGQSSYFTSCYWHFNLCAAIFYQLVWSMNSKEWPQTFHAFKFLCFISPNAHLLLSKGKPITFQSALGYHDAHIDSVMHDQARQSKILRRVLKR